MNEPHDHEHETRRTFLLQLTKLGAAGAGFLLGAPLAGQDKPKPVLATVKISEHPELADAGGNILLKGTAAGDILVIDCGKDQYSVLSNICPHRQCKVKVKSPELIQCPCHKSTYLIDGTYTSGPAKHDLTRFAFSIKDGVLTIFEE